MKATTLFLLGLIEASSPSKSVAVFGLPNSSLVRRAGEMVGSYRFVSTADGAALLQKGSETVRLKPGQWLEEQGPQVVTIRDGLERGEGKIMVTRVLHDYIAKEGLMTIIMQACSEPAYTDDGRMLGYRLFEIDAGSAFDLAGIRDQDIVTEIDGILLDSPWVALKALSLVKDASVFDFKYLRNGKEEKVRVEVQ